MKILSLLLGLVAFFTTLFRPLNAQDYQAYLRQHTTTFQADQVSSFSLFDSSFYNSDIFLLGETHGYATPQTIDLALLKHLNQRIGLRYYLAEMDVAQADLVNQYLKTGNAATLDSLFRGFLRQTNAGTSQWGNKEFYNKIVAIRAYNQTLPITARIQFIGVDWFQDRGRPALDLLKYIVRKQIMPNQSSQLLDSLRQVVMGDSLNLVKIKPFANRIRADIAANPTFYQQTFGDHQLLFQHFFELLSCVDDHLTRDQVQARMTQFLIKEMRLQNEKLYGLWGYTHILQAGVGKEPTFSGLLAQSGRRVRSMAMLFKDSKMLVHRDHLPFFLRKSNETFSEVENLNADSKVFKVDKFDDVDALSPTNQTTLFKLDAPNSPYQQNLRLVKVSGLTGTKIEPYSLAKTVTTDYFQYVFVVKNSPAITIWNKQD